MLFCVWLLSAQSYDEIDPCSLCTHSSSLLRLRIGFLSLSTTAILEGIILCCGEGAVLCPVGRLAAAMTPTHEIRSTPWL